MPRRDRFFRLALCLACLAALAFSTVYPVVAQQGATIAVTSPSPDANDLVRQGRQLEIERRWAEALSHYEAAVRQFPQDSTLQRRLELSRLHYDMGRRYADRSFCDALGAMSVEKALDSYGQVLLKIEAHYVDEPNWKMLVERGTDDFEVALSEPAFVERCLAPDRTGSIDAFRHELRRTLGPRVISTRQDARDAVAVAAELARQRLAVNPTAVVLEYLCGATNSLDPYSAYLTPDQLNEVYSQIEGNFVGLGIELRVENNELVIVRVIAGSPARESGMLAGDRILAVDGQSTRNLSTDEAANLLQGLAGTMVRLSIATPGQPPRQIVVQRRRVDVPSIDQVGIVDRDFGVAYLRLLCFQKSTATDLEEALWRLHRQGMRALVIDLRGNPGGLLVTSVEAVDKFVERGVIVSTRGRSAQEDFTYSAHASGTWRVPLVVLIDQDSASAAEIFAGAIRDHRRGTIVGQRSYGKGSVQGIFPLDVTDAGVRLTTAKFYSPSGRPFNLVGVQPDLPVHLAAKPVDGRLPSRGADDATLATAVQAARQLVQPQHAQRLR